MIIIAIATVGLFFAQSRFRKIEPTPHRNTTDVVPQKVLCRLEDIKDNNKFGGLVFMHATKKNVGDNMFLFLHFDHELTDDEIQQIEQLGVIINRNSWIPPAGTHPTGFYISRSEIADICKLADLDLVKRVTSAEETYEPQNEPQ